MNIGTSDSQQRLEEARNRSFLESFPRILPYLDFGLPGSRMLRQLFSAVLGYLICVVYYGSPKNLNTLSWKLVTFTTHLPINPTPILKPLSGWKLQIIKQCCHAIPTIISPRLPNTSELDLSVSPPAWLMHTEIWEPLVSTWRCLCRSSLLQISL